MPAAACIEYERSPGMTIPAWSSYGYYSVVGAGAYVTLHCPLPLNNVDLSGTTSDDDLSKIRVHYRDGDGVGTDGLSEVRLVRTVIGGATTQVCRWSSNADGTGSGSATRSTKACAHDLGDGAFYHLDASLRSGTSGPALDFAGVDFPQ